MKTILLSVFSLFVAVAVASTDPVTSENVNIEKSSIEWFAKKVTGEHNGTVNLESASLYVENGMITGGMFVIDMNSIAVTDLKGNMAAKLEGHLKSDDFFGVATHPTATLEITGSEKAGGNEHTVTADLTIKGITESIEFTATVDGKNASATITVDRSKFDVRYGSKSFFDGLGDKMIYDNFDLQVNLVMN